MILWGFSFIWFKQANLSYHPISIVFMRLGIASVLLYPAYWLFGSGQKFKTKDLLPFLLLALFDPFFYFLGESFGLSRVSSTVGAVIVALIPVFVPFAAFYAFREKLTKLNYFGILVSFTGVLMVIINRDLRISASPTGLALMFLAVIAAVIYTILLKKITTNYDLLFIITWQNIIGTLYFLPLFLIFGMNDLTNKAFSIDQFIPIIKLAIFASSLAFILYAYGLKRVGASRASVFLYIIPVITAILSYFILKEEFNLFKIIGIIIVVGGLFLTQLRTFRKKEY